VLARFNLPYRLFEFVAAVRALESDHMRIGTCHRRMPKEEAAPDGWQGLGVVGETKPPGRRSHGSRRFPCWVPEVINPTRATLVPPGEPMTPP